MGRVLSRRLISWLSVISSVQFFALSMPLEMTILVHTLVLTCILFFVSAELVQVFEANINM